MMDRRCRVGVDFCDFECLLAFFLVPGASNLSSFFDKFHGRAPGSLLGAFCMLFGCPLGALGTSLEDFGSTLAALGVALERVVPMHIYIYMYHI